jgi:RNA polymerase sigma-70 factor (ECF subfamily)
MHTTSVSLLERLCRSPATNAWDRFVELYTPLLFYWARRLGLQESDAADLVQDIFTVLVEEVPRFRYEPGKRFRGWLWTVTVNRFREKRRRRDPTPQADEGVFALTTTPDDTAALDEAEYRTYLVDRALRLMRAEFQPTTWQACWEYVVSGRSATEVAAELGITVNAVHLAKSRVMRRLRDELEGLLE